MGALERRSGVESVSSHSLKGGGSEMSRDMLEGRASKTKRVKRLMYLGTVIVVVALLALAIGLSPRRGGIGINEGDIAQDFVVEDLDGTVFRLSAHRAHVVLVDWMGVRCAPCRQQMPFLVQAYNVYRDRGLAMISIDVNDVDSMLAAQNEEEARAFFSEFGATWSVVLERSGLATRYGIIGIPTIMVVDTSGVIVFKRAGVHTFDELKSVIEPKLPA